MIFSSSYAQGNKKAEFSALVGLSFYNLKYYSQYSILLPEHSPALSFLIGGGAQLFINNKFSLEADILYKVKKSEVESYSGIEWYDVFYTFKYLAFPIVAHYYFPVTKFKIFVTLGMEPDILLKSHVESTNSVDFQLISGLGIRYNKFSLEFRYGKGLLNLNAVRVSNFTIMNRGFEFLVAFHFLNIRK